MSALEITSKVWNYAHVLRDDGVGYGDYVESAPAQSWPHERRECFGSPCAPRFLGFLPIAITFLNEKNDL